MTIAFAGPLSRFYARRGGDPARFRPGVEVWRADLQQSVAGKVAAQLQWDEAVAAAATTDLGPAGLAALRLFAFYAERSDLELPDTVPALLEFDPEWRAAAEAKFAKSHYGQLLACEVWLPGEFPVTLRVPLPDGATGEVGSLDVLVDQLRWLNQRTFGADAEVVVGWLDLPAAVGGDLLTAAQRGYAALWAAAGAAAARRVPLCLAPD